MSTPRRTATIFLCGDVMLGRGIDQLFAQGSDPALEESYLHDARDYIALAEQQHGPISRPVSPAYVWGDALDELERSAPDLRLINLETSITTSARYWPGKEIHYRLHPANVAAVTTARIDACALANNHVLDFGREGLAQTLQTLQGAGVLTAGAGLRLSEARVPAQLALPGGGTLSFFSTGTEDSGIDTDWAAGDGTSGVDLLPDLSTHTAEALAGAVRAFKRRPGDLAVVSIHWGSNWGYRIPAEQVRFAQRLVDGGVDVVHGHSSHHPRPLEVYRGKLILYGCGDFISDYEGIEGYEKFRSDLRLMYLAKLNRETGALDELRITPFQSYRLRLRRASAGDVLWQGATLEEASRPFGTRLSPEGTSALVIRGPQ
jgi:poly-gamma-glutamate synthesis protein (capsule biosynthesis protein)